MDNNNIWFQLPTVVISVTPVLLCSNEPPVGTSRMPMNPPRAPPVVTLRMPMNPPCAPPVVTLRMPINPVRAPAVAIYPPAMSLRSAQTITQDITVVKEPTTIDTSRMPMNPPREPPVVVHPATMSRTTAHTVTQERLLDEVLLPGNGAVGWPADSSVTPKIVLETVTTDSGTENQLIERLLDEVLLPGNGAVGWPADSSVTPKIVLETVTTDSGTENQLIEHLWDDIHEVLFPGNGPESSGTGNLVVPQVKQEPSAVDISVRNQEPKTDLEGIRRDAKIHRKKERKRLAERRRRNKIRNDPTLLEAFLRKKSELKKNLEEGLINGSLMKCLVPHCTKVCAYNDLDSHYMAVHANLNIVDEASFSRFISNN